MRRPLTVATIGRHYFSIGRQNNRECRDGADHAFRPEYLRVAPSLLLIASSRRSDALRCGSRYSRSFYRGPRWIADGGSSFINLILKPRMKSRGFQPKPRKAGAGSNTISFAIRVPMAHFDTAKTASSGFWQRPALNLRVANLASTQIGWLFWESWVYRRLGLALWAHAGR